MPVSKNKFTSAARSIVAAILQLQYGTKYIPKHVLPDEAATVKAGAMP